MTTAREHYETLLADHYSWLFGDFETRVQEQSSFFTTHGITPGEPAKRLAVDLGAGPGFQAIALARLGFRVQAIDFSTKLVRELAERAAGLPVQAIEDDLLHFPHHVIEAPELVTCMGDTLTHLDSLGTVRRLVASVRERIAPGGRFMVTYRDLSLELTGPDRILPVRSDDRTIFTCFLEYTPDRVNVHDIVHVRADGGWQMKASVYPKLRLARSTFEQWLRGAGFEIEHADTVRGLAELVARAT
jgi:SAM-dependent methyltransferase